MGIVERDPLEQSIRDLWGSIGPLDRNEITSLLLNLFYRIETLEDKLKERDDNTTD